MAAAPIGRQIGRHRGGAIEGGRVWRGTRPGDHRLGRGIAAGVDRRAVRAGQGRVVCHEVCSHASICRQVARRRQVGPGPAIPRIFKRDAVPAHFHLMTFPISQIQSCRAHGQDRRFRYRTCAAGIDRVRDRTGVAVGESASGSVVGACVVGGPDNSPGRISSIAGSGRVEAEEPGIITAAIRPSAGRGLGPRTVRSAGDAVGVSFFVAAAWTTVAGTVVLRPHDVIIGIATK